MILHIAPSHVDNRPGQGSHKDVAARKAWFRASGHDYRYVSVHGDDVAQLAQVLMECRPTHVLIEYSYYPRIVRHMRRRFPQAVIGIRSHNIEPLQHWTVADFERPMDVLRTVYTCVRLFFGDLVVAWTADTILSISPFEVRRYWPLLGVGHKVRWLPYLPPPEFREAPTPQPRTVIACVPGVTSTRTRDQVNRFAQFAQAARRQGWTEHFQITGNVTGWKVRLTPEAQTIGFVDDLPTFYRGVAAAAILSPLGYGFKTTLADAIWCGARAIVHPAIYAEMPEELKPHCMVLASVDPKSLSALHEALHEPLDPVPAITAVNARFQQEMADFLQRRPRVGAQAT